MAHSLEARVPFLDPVVTNFALALPSRHKVRGLRKKVLLRKAAAPLVPPELASAPKARLLDSGGSLAPRRARAVRARDALLRHASAPGLLPPGGRERASSTTTWRAARISAASSGACSRSRSGTSATSSARRALCGSLGSKRSPGEGLGRHLRAGSCAGVPAPDRAPPRARRRGRGHDSRVRADARAARAARDRGRGDRAPRRPLAPGQGRLARRPAASPEAVRERPRLRPRARARLA